MGRGQGQAGGQQLVGDARPAGCRGLQGAVRSDPEVDLRELAVERHPPGREIQRRIIGQGAQSSADRAQARQLGLAWRGRRGRDVVGRQESAGVIRIEQVIVRGLGRPGPPAIVRAGAMLAVGETQRRGRTETPCNGIHGE